MQTIAGFLTNSRVYSAKPEQQVAQPDCNPNQTQTTRTNNPHKHQEVDVLSNISLLLTEKNKTNKHKPLTSPSTNLLAHFKKMIDYD
jgi:hypothetical protein